LISTGNDREATLGELAGLILALERSSPVRVAIDGRTASGKTTFANELGAVVAQRNREVIRTSIDGFHQPRAERYARGRYSPEGHYFDAWDLGAIRGLLLDPLRPGGGRQYRTASCDLERDATIEQAPLTAVLFSSGRNSWTAGTSPSSLIRLKLSPSGGVCAETPSAWAAQALPAAFMRSGTDPPSLYTSDYVSLASSLTSWWTIMTLSIL
jgi:hypothetical protein